MTGADATRAALGAAAHARRFRRLLALAGAAPNLLAAATAESRALDREAARRKAAMRRRLLASRKR